MSSAKGGNHEVDVFASAIDVLDGEGRVKKTILLLPIGTFTLRDGRGPYTVKDRAHAEAIVTASLKLAGQQQLHFDYEHSLLFKAPKGEESPASGWVTRLFADDEGVKADVDWTVPATARLLAREYRYISPLFRAEEKSGLVTRLINAALTNNPAIDGLPAIAASQQTKDSPMKLTAIAAALGLTGESPTEEQVVAAATSLTTRLKASVSALGLNETATEEQIVTASATLKDRKVAKAGEIIVPAAAYDALQKKVDDLAEKDIAASVDAAIAAGKFTPAQRGEMLDFARHQPDRFNSFVGKKEVVVSAGAVLDGDAPAKNANGLTEVEVAAAASAGLTEEEFIAARDALEKEPK